MPARTRLVATLMFFSVGLLAFTITWAGVKENPSDELKVGRELFLREWVANDSRSHGGDGLGPVFNDSSCVACHNLGGTGGGGPANKNVQIVSAFPSPRQMRQSGVPRVGLTDVIGGLTGLRNLRGSPAQAATPSVTDQKEELEKLGMLHPGFRSSRSVVLHRFGTKADYDEWKTDLFFHDSARRRASDSDDPEFDVPLAQHAESAARNSQPVAPSTHDRSRANRARQNAAQGGVNGMRSFPGAGVINVQKGNFLLTTSQRNTTALFGAGLIDSISDKAIEANATAQNANAGTTGRLARLPNGKIGRFGWKSQKATLHEFAMTACAVELGLNVPEHPQAGLAYDPGYKSPGFDMDQKECVALVSFLKSIPAPIELKPVTKKEAEFVHGGRELFASVGCAQCHTPKLGEVAGIYSDLLLHDMGPELGDTGSYGAFIPGSATDDINVPVPEALTNVDRVPLPGPKQQAVAAAKPPTSATRQEWRTPPLWGVRDSGPYLHDGRAETLEQAIAMHGGQGTQSSQKFFQLPRSKRQQLISFLKTLVAPEQLATAR